MTPSGPTPATDEVQQALQRLRVLGAVTVLLVVLVRRSEASAPVPSVALGIVVAVGLVLLGVVTRWGRRRGLRGPAAVILQIGADAVLVVGGLWATAAPLDSSASLLLLVPVLEAAVRFRVLGAVACWGGCVALLAGRELVAWYPGDPLPVAPLAEVATVLLVVTLPAAYLAEHLAAQLLVADRARGVAERRVDLLVDLAAASRELNAPSVDAVVAATLRAVESLTARPVRAVGLDDVPEVTEVVLRPGPDELGVAVTIRGDRVGFVVETALDPGDEHLVGEALEVLAAQAQVTLRNAELHGRLRASVTELSHRAHHDALTGLANRAHLVDTAQRRLAAGEDVGLLYVDLDRFKPVNDRYGHEAGDRVLQEVARRLTVAAGEAGMPARLGGDEFAVLLRDGGDPAAVAAQVIHHLAAPIDLEVAAVTVGASIGSADSWTDGRDIDELLRAADARMYDVKEHSRGSGAVRTRR